MACTFEIYKDKAGKFRYRMRAANKEIIMSGQAYKSKASCKNGIASIKKNSKKDVRYDRFKAKNGKLRLLYECNPMAYITEQAGGKASDGHTRIMDLKPTELHQRVPFFCGSKNMVSKVEEFIQKHDK